MEVLGYLHTAVAYESVADEDATRDTFRNEHASPLDWVRSSSLKGLRTSSLGIAALLWSLSCFATLAPPATAMMRNGDSGVEVTRLQQDLARLGYFNTNATGYFGSITQSAVEQFQRANGLAVDGIVGPVTEAALQARMVTTFMPNPVVNASFVNSVNSPAVVPAVQTTMIPTATVQPSLRFGVSGTSVTQLQTQLTRVGVYQGPITGFYGQLTEAAVIRFQQLNGLIPTGVADSSTLMLLNQAPLRVETVARERVERVPTQLISQPTAPVIVQTVAQPSVNQPPNNRVVVSPSNEMIYLGDSGQAVRDIQRILTDQELYNGPITGYYGAQTREAVMQFQQRVGIDADGVTGPMTWQALLNRDDFV
jgi:peptidoglycan hydrolase-like protein with peptidoglycan-binding domain